MTKLIINNQSSASDQDALLMVSKVIDAGRISNNKTEYCYCTVFSLRKCAVYASKNKCSDRFLILDDFGINEEGE